MQDQITVIVEEDEGWFIAYCPEVPGANGQGRTEDEAVQSLRAAVQLIGDEIRGQEPAR